MGVDDIMIKIVKYFMFKYAALISAYKIDQFF